MSQNKNKKPLLDKEFGLSSWAIDNKTTVYIIMAILLIGGMMAFNNMPREAYPEIEENKIYISSIYPGNSAEDVEKLVTIPIEAGIRNLSGVQKITSSSFQDYSMITVELDTSISLLKAKIDIKDKIDAVKSKSDWPTLDTGGKVEPSVFEISFSEEQAIIYINVEGDYSLQQLKSYSEKIKDQIETLSAIKVVSLNGVDDKEVEVAVDLFKMAATHVDYQDIIKAIKANNTTISGGNVINNLQRSNLRVVGKIQKPQELLNIVIKSDNGPVYLRDIATVNFREQDKTTFARNRDKTAIILAVKKRAGSNMIKAVADLREIVTKMQADVLPKDLRLTYSADQSNATESQVSDLVNNIIFGIILVVGVLMFFLGFKNAAFVGIAIPLSMLFALLILSNFVTMNTMVLFGLVMGLGMLVDNGIVVVENVYRLIDEGMDRKTAAKQGIGEIAWPIITSTATTLAAFFPLGLWPGTMGKFMIYFPMTLSAVLGASLFVALVINSMLTSEFMNTKKEENISNESVKKNSLLFIGVGFLSVLLGFFVEIDLLKILGNLAVLIGISLWLYKYFIFPVSKTFQHEYLPKLEAKYKVILEKVFTGKRPQFLLLGTFLLLIFSFILVGVTKPNILFFPDNTPKQIMVYMEYPEGTDIKKTFNKAKEIEKEVLVIVDSYNDDEGYNPLVESSITQIGKGAGNPFTGGNASETPHKAKIVLTMREFKYRKGKDSKELMTVLRKKLNKFNTEITVSIEKDLTSPPAGYPFNLEIYGTDYDQMLIEAESLKNFISSTGVAGLEKLKLDVNKNVSEIELTLNLATAGSLGITNQFVGGTLRAAIFGQEASIFKPDNDDDDYKINVRLKADQRYDMALLLNQPLTYKDMNRGTNMQVPISSLVSQKQVKSFNVIKRRDHQKVISLYSNVLDGYNAGKIIEKIESQLKNRPSKFEFKFTGEQEKQAEDGAFLLKALLIAVSGISLIIVLQFNSISKPIIIMSTVILSFIGVFLGLIIFQMDFVVIMTMMGIISLAGIVVNNSIVLIDYTELLISRKKLELGIADDRHLDKKTILNLVIESGTSRLLPVLLTAITTVLGLLPLAIGLNIDFISFLTDYNPHIYLGGDNVVFWGPLAWTVIFGLTFATFLTLVMVPVMFYLTAIIKLTIQNKKDAKLATN